MKRIGILIVLGITLLVYAPGCGDDNPTSINELKYSSVDEHTFVVGANPFLSVSDFVGSISVKTGVQDTIHVIATRRAAREQDLDVIDISMVSNPNELDISADKPAEVENVEADFEITVPPGTRVELTSGVGSILYRGRPRDLNRFDVGVGSIMLYLPANVNVAVDLTVGVGEIDSDFIIDGQATNTTVIGIIGNGGDGEIRASTGVGRIELLLY